ncbi:ABC transporter substrate-binding protein [Phytopseudomonas punonensis]|uniref:Iron complex transport system substrate-binding protein n=1 Tax=Phytopseudomonas punonensis TaxID=1220495 RepID=A0A1M7P2M1_9GAMM|nr:ABC transporter substrate-binding protein [Pseudomonas punonensis]SHN10779.1 iron complex transport system substrate-binding protein [Pseudomonas punonensis]
MKKAALFTLLALATAGCSHDGQQRPATLKVTQAGQQAEIAHDPQRIVTFDYGSYDSLIVLGAGERVLAVPGNVPPYLADKVGRTQDAGNMKTPDIDAIAALKPDLILITGRQSESRQALQALAPTLDIGITGDDYFAGVANNARLLGQLVDKSAEAQQALSALQSKAEKARQQVAASGQRTLVLTHNEGRFAPTEHALIYSLLQAPRALPLPAPQPAGTPRQRPLPLDADAIAAARPDVIFIIDRSAAIGATPLDVTTLADSPLARTPAAQAKQVVYLDPALWYLSGGGLKSVDLQIDQVLAAYSR